MNLLEILSMTLRIYRANGAWFSLAGFTLLLASLISSGVLVGAFLLDALIALFFGPAGSWISKPPVAAAILGVTLAGLMLSTFLLFSSIGAFMHFCAQIGAGRREINMLAFLEYAKMHGPAFWLIGMVHQMVGLLISTPFVVAAFLSLSSMPILAWVLLALGVAGYTFGQLPFWLAYPAQIINRKGAFRSLGVSLKASLSAPFTSLTVLFLLFLLGALPAVTLVLYPIYFFFIFAPLASTLMLVYFEAVQGLIK